MKYNWNIFFCPPHLATSWNCARVMLGPLNLFTISLILKSEISYLEPLHNISDLGGENWRHLPGKKKREFCEARLPPQY